MSKAGLGDTALLVLDSWGLLAYLKDEPSAGKIEAAWIDEGAAISMVNLGEVLYIRMRDVGREEALGEVSKVRAHLKLIEPDWSLIQVAAAIKADGGLSFSDAICVATALRLEVPLWTGDPEILTRAERHDCATVDLRSPEADSNR